MSHQPGCVVESAAANNISTNPIIDVTISVRIITLD